MFFRRRQHTGFSLLELLIVLVMVSAIAVMVAPRLSGTLSSLSLKNLSRELASSLRTTQQLAINQGQEAVWTIDLERLAYRSSQQAKWQPLDSKTKVLLTTGSREQVSDAIANIRFFADGSATGGEVALQRGNLSYKVQVDWLTGRVKVYDGA